MRQSRQVPREVVVITGLPGSGKTTLAVPLATALDAALVARDTIKEALGDALGPVDDARSQLLGRASYEVLFAIARSTPGRVVVESNFGAEAVPTLQGLTEGPIVQVFCTCPVDLAVSRYRSRPRHPVHRIPVVSERRLLEMGPVSPLPLDGRTITVDTTTRVDVEAVAREVVEATTSRRGADGERQRPSSATQS